MKCMVLALLRWGARGAGLVRSVFHRLSLMLIGHRRDLHATDSWAKPAGERASQGPSHTPQHKGLPLQLAHAWVLQRPPEAAGRLREGRAGREARGGQWALEAQMPQPGLDGSRPAVPHFMATQGG